MTFLDHVVERVLDIVMPKLVELVESHGGRARDGIVLSGTHDPATGQASVAVCDTTFVFTDDGDQPAVMDGVPIGNPHVGDQYGPIGDERVALIPTQSGYIAIPHHGPDDSIGAPAGERWIAHRNPQTKQVDVLLKITNDGPTTGDGLGGVVWMTGARFRFATAGGWLFRLNDTANQASISSPSGSISLTLDGATGEVWIGGMNLTPTNGVVRAEDETANLTAFKAAMVTAGVTNAGAIVIPAAIAASSTVLAK